MYPLSLFQYKATKLTRFKKWRRESGEGCDGVKLAEEFDEDDFDQELIGQEEEDDLPQLSEGKRTFRETEEEEEVFERNLLVAHSADGQSAAKATTLLLFMIFMTLHVL